MERRGWPRSTRSDANSAGPRRGPRRGDPCPGYTTVLTGDIRTWDPVATALELIWRVEESDTHGEGRTGRAWRPGRYQVAVAENAGSGEASGVGSTALAPALLGLTGLGRVQPDSGTALPHALLCSPAARWLPGGGGTQLP